ncbi:putative pectinesterase/pectinesterase inhibitor [Trifolium repens]|nr:putative pectinesterase/pectinesterase inhibitor [Trifolium repens]
MISEPNEAQPTKTVRFYASSIKFDENPGRSMNFLECCCCRDTGGPKVPSQRRFVGPFGVKEYKNLSYNVLETVHRINVGGMKLTPFNDTLWRTWIPDKDFLVFKEAAKTVVSTHTPDYQKGAVSGERFIAVDITFKNTAGPEKHQAVAVRNNADLSTFYRCSFEGYQDTLYVHSLRQFYRDCKIYGTVDFIFVNAAVVFQNCNIYARKPTENQKNAVTVQGRTDPNQNYCYCYKGFDTLLIR